MHWFLDSFLQKNLFYSSCTLSSVAVFDLSTFQPFLAFHFLNKPVQDLWEPRNSYQMFPSTYTTSCKWSGMQTITNLVDLGKKMELLDPQNLSSKFIFPRGFSARRLDYLGNCGMRTNMGVGLLHTYRCHRCTTKNSSFVVTRAFRFVGQHYCGLFFMFICSSCSALRLEAR